MEYRQLGRSGLKVPVLSFGTLTFGGTDPHFRPYGDTGIGEAARLVDICLERGVNFFDTADIYSYGEAEEVLGKALEGKRDRALIATKATFTMGPGPNEKGSSRWHLIRSLEASLKRLRTDYVDIYFMHGFDALTPVEETLSALDNFVQSGKVRYIGCSNFSGWHLMKSLSVSEKHGLARYVVYQGYYSLIGRDYEAELMPLGLDQGVGLMAWSPLGWGRLTGKIKRGLPLPEGRLKMGRGDEGPQMEDEHLYKVIDAIEEISKETGKSVPQIAINWVMQRPSVSNVVIGARNEAQLLENLGAFGWSLTKTQIAKLDLASERQLAYPYWHQRQFLERIPSPV